MAALSKPWRRNRTTSMPNTLNARNIQSGGLSPSHLTLDIQSPGPGAIPDKKKPWLDLEGFFVFMKETGHRIHLLFIPKKRPKGIQGVQATLFPPSPSANIRTETTVQAPRTNSLGPRTVFLAEKKRQESTSSAQQHSDISPPYYSAPGTARSGESEHRLSFEAEVESIQKHIQSSVSGPSRYSDTSSDQQGYIPPPKRPDNEEWKSTAVIFKDGLGEMRGHKMFYDTGSQDNWASEKLVIMYHLTPRPILPQNLTVYRTVKYDFTPTHYVEIELKDDSRNIKDTKVVFNITPSMEGIGLLVGSGFIQKHEIVIDPRSARDAFVTIGRKANAAAQEAQKKLFEKAEQDRKYARGLASTSTAGSTTMQSGNSQEQPVAFSRTSTSSSTNINNPKL